jgi:predicted permease
MRLLPDTFNNLKVINMIVAASPSAINVALFARKYNSNYKRAAELVCLTTIFCFFNYSHIYLFYKLRNLTILKIVITFTQ